LIVGGGVAGTRVAQNLSQAGLGVHLVEKQPVLGGHTAAMGCKATNVCLKCNACLAHDTIKGALSTPGVNIHTFSELTSVQPGANGSLYTAVLTCGPTYIDPTICIGCGICVDLAPQQSIAIPNSALSPIAVMVDESAWLKATSDQRNKCSQACPANAINPDAKETTRKIDVDAVVIATGYEEYDPAENNLYGYGLVSNVITGIEAEKQLARQNKITRPSDGTQPKRIGFVQCVGSRTEEIYRRVEDTDYCSVVCCAYALRIAQKMQYQTDDADITIFYMDIQNFGKGFNAFYRDCKDKMTFVRSRPYEIKQAPDDNVIVRYTAPEGTSKNGNAVIEDQFDMVILSVGIRPRQDNLADKLALPVDEYGFLGIKRPAGLFCNMQREAFYAVGAVESPKDIAGCIRQADAVSATIISEV